MDDMHIYAAMQEDGFAVFAAADTVLASLEAEKHNQTDELFALNAVLGGLFSVSGVVTCQPITPAIWAFLWAIGNAYARHEDIKPIDSDIFLYVLSHGLKELPTSPVTLAVKAAGFCATNGLDYDAVEADLREMVYVAFRPFEMLPDSGASGTKAVFDADWLISLAACVAPQSNLTFRQIVFETSLAACCYFYVQARRKYDTANLIRRRSSDELAAAIWARTVELGKEYYAKKQGGAACQ